MRKQVSAYRNPVAPRVGLLVETSLASGREILRGISKYVREHAPWVLYHEPHGMENALPRWLKRWRGEGIIARIQTAEMARTLATLDIPIVDVLGVSRRFPLVHVDNAAIARLAADHLLERGLQQFAFFGIGGENWSQQRYAGLCAAVAPVQRDVPRYELPRRALDARAWDRMEDKLAAWIRALPRPTGVLVCSDQRGPQFLEACRRAGVNVPDEVAVIGVDNDEPLCEVCSPPLSSIQPGHAAVGYEAASLLNKLMRGDAAPRTPLLLAPQQVLARLSTDTFAVADPIVHGALRLIREGAHLCLSVDTIAREVGVSRSVLQRRFQERLKRTVHQEIVDAKIKKARELILKTDLPLSVVAERAGFRHQEYMGAVFKARLGMTPGKVRQAERQ